MHAIHTELLSDLSSSYFIAGFHRFCARRGTPATVYSDNGSNFVGANKELRNVHQTIINTNSMDSVTKQAIHPLEWKFFPASAPHFGGLWEAGVKAMMLLLRKNVGSHPLSFEELTTILAVSDSVLKSRPLLPHDSLPTDGDMTLTPGHLLIGRPL